MSVRAESIETALRSADTWIRDYGSALGQSHPDLCYRCLRAGLHAIRDRLPVAETAALAAQLPLIVRGMFYDGWSPSHPPPRPHTTDEILDRVAAELEGGLRAPPAAVLRATFATLERHVDGGEIAKLKPILPAALRSMWSERASLGTGI